MRVIRAPGGISWRPRLNSYASIVLKQVYRTTDHKYHMRAESAEAPDWETVSFPSLDIAPASASPFVGRGRGGVEGEVRAARWALTQPPGLYSMMDVLGLA